MSSIFTLPPLPDSLDLPSLPPIEDEKLARQVFTHASYVAAPRNASDFFETPDESVDSEKLEHVGDAILGCVVTLMLHQLYPRLKQGPATALKSHLVRDSTFAQLSRRYGLPSRLIADQSAKPVLLASEKTVASLFEAYVAGLFQYYLSCSASDGSARTDGDALDLVADWLRPLFGPLASWVLDELREYHSRFRDPGETEPDEKALGALARLNQHFIAHEGGMPDITITGDSGQWTARCRAILKDGTVLTAEGTRGTKKAAKAIAAWKIGRQLDWE